MLELRGEIEEADAPLLDLDELMERLRSEVEARKRQARKDEAVTAGALAADYEIDALLALPDAQFVRAAYQLALDRAPSEHEAAGSLNRLLLGRVSRSGLLREFVDSDEGRGRGARIEGLSRAEQRERANRSVVGRLFLDIASGWRTLRLLPKRIRQFVRRVEWLEQKLSDANLRLDALEREMAALKSSSRVAESPDVE